MNKTFLLLFVVLLAGIFTTFKIKSIAMEQKNQPKTFYVLFHSPGAKWVDSLAFREQPGVMDHVGYMSSFLESKKLVEGGPFLDNSGGMMIFNVSKEEAETIASGDPAVKSGLLKVTVKPWMQAMNSK